MHCISPYSIFLMMILFFIMIQRRFMLDSPSATTTNNHFHEKLSRCPNKNDAIGKARLAIRNVVENVLPIYFCSTCVWIKLWSAILYLVMIAAKKNIAKMSAGAETANNRNMINPHEMTKPSRSTLSEVSSLIFLIDKAPIMPPTAWHEIATP